MLLFTGIPVAPLAGTTESTPGAVASGVAEAPVVKLLENGTTALPARSVKPLTCRVNGVLTASGSAAANTRVNPSLLRSVVPATVLPPWDKTTASLPTLAALIGSLKRTTTWALTGTPALPLGGLTATTAGATVSLPNPVVKYDWKKTALPARSVMLKACTRYAVA